MPQVFYQIQFWIQIYLLLKYLFQFVYYHHYVFNPLINFECLFPKHREEILGILSNVSEYHQS